MGSVVEGYRVYSPPRCLKCLWHPTSPDTNTKKDKYFFSRGWWVSTYIFITHNQWFEIWPNVFIFYRKFIPPPKVLNEDRFSFSSTSATTSTSSSSASASTSRSSSLKSPSYEKLIAESPLQKTPKNETLDESSNSEKTPTIQRSPCDDDDETSLSDDDETSHKRHGRRRRSPPFEFVTPNRLHPNIRRVAAEDDDMSDTDSLAR